MQGGAFLRGTGRGDTDNGADYCVGFTKFKAVLRDFFKIYLDLVAEWINFATSKAESELDAGLRN